MFFYVNFFMYFWIIVSSKRWRSRLKLFYKTGVKIFSKFAGKHQCRSLLFNKVPSSSPATLLKKRLWHRCSSVDFEELPKHPFCRSSSNGCFWKRKNQEEQHGYEFVKNLILFVQKSWLFGHSKHLYQKNYEVILIFV